jgi:serine/threonine protein kinase
VTAPHLGPGHTIAGRYTVRALLGFAGEAAAYHAVGSDGREVVVKLYDPAIGQRADVMAQLERVHALSASMPAALVVAIVDAGYDTGTGAPFIAAERLHIPSLTRIVDSGPQSPPVVARIVYGIARVLEAGRAIGLHHYGLKPNNIFVGPTPDCAVRITDFGASVVRSACPSHEAFARAAPWWAPEQLQPAAVLSAATDSFAIALVAFFALTGRSYWRSCQASQPDLAAWQAEIMGARTPVSARARELGAFVPQEMDEVFRRALSVRQAERPDSVEVLADALAAVGAGAEAPPKTVAFAPGIAPAAGQALALSETAGAPRASFAAAGSTPSPGDSEGVTPGLPPFPRRPKKRPSSIVPIVVGVAAAALLGGGGILFLFLRSDSKASATAPVDRAASDAGATASDGVGGADQGGAEGEGGNAEETDPSAKVPVALRCEPPCDALYVDNQSVERPREALQLAPGRYAIRAIKNGYLAASDTIEVEPGKPFEKEYRLVKIAGGRPPPPSEDCGQFLKPCK